MSDMQQNFDEQLAGKDSEMNCRLDNVNQKHETELSGVLMQFVVYFCDFDFFNETCTSAST